MPEYAKINRKVFAKEMPAQMKKAFMILIQKHPALPSADKDFVCDFLHNYESISDANRTEVLDVIDSMELFVVG
jgi:hypothetical protein